MYLVKDDERLPCNNCLTGMGLNVSYDSVRFQVVKEQVLGKTIICTIDINDMFIFIASKVQ